MSTNKFIYIALLEQKSQSPSRDETFHSAKF